ncbi:MAG TPA: sigma-70 family RNA polymerase sigma factor [Polyangiaceae bacterium]
MTPISLRTSTLSDQEERALVSRWKHSCDLDARDHLVRAHLKYVALIARRYRGYRVPLDELVAEGSFGMVHALSKFDPTRGGRFLTYAKHWIRSYIVDYILRSRSLVRSCGGVFSSRMFFKVRRESSRVSNLVGHSDDATELLAARLGVSPERAAWIVSRADSPDVSLDASVHRGTDLTLLDLLPCVKDNDGPPHSDESRTRAVRAALCGLDVRERYIVEKRLMADAEEALSLAAIGRFFGISRERTRQLEERAKRKLRHRVLELCGPPD